jgi:hypothetical protein
MAITQGLLRNDFSYRAPYGSNRRSPSYTNPQRGAAKAPAPSSTGALESRSVVRGPGIANDEMDESDDAEMVTQTQTPLTANARGPRYTEGSMMDLFTGQRTGTKNANYNADQPITDTNTPYLATKGFWGGLDRVLGNKSNELNEAAQQQQGAKWDAANKLKASQDREDTVTKNANTFTTGRDETQAGYARDAAELANNRKVRADERGFEEARSNTEMANIRKDAEDTRNRNRFLADRGTTRQDTLDDQGTANKQKKDAALALEGGLNARQQNVLSNNVTQTSDGTFIKNGMPYIQDPTNPLNFIPLSFEKPRGSGGSGGNTGPGRAAKNGQGGDAKTIAQPPASQAAAAPDNAPVTRSAKPAYLSSDNNFAGPIQDPNSDAAKTAAAQMAEYNASPSADDPNPLASIAESYSGSLFPLVKGAGKIMSKVGPGGTGVIKKLASFIIDKAGEFNPKQQIQQQEEQQKLQDDEMIRRARNSRKPSFTE